ncbi:MAG: hypothetical protein IPG84_10780 [Betaproteobacteria bacterium]|nr:hypothetical protein [Betaproteobacteria bacterium]
MKNRVFAALAMGAFLCLPLSAAAATKAEKQADVRKMERETLARLYKASPGAKGAVEKAAGYAVFSNFGMKILVAGGGGGSGVAVDNASKKATYMKMAEVQAGLGIGVKKFRLVVGVRVEAGAGAVRQLRLGVRRAGVGRGQGRRQGRFLPGGDGGLARRLGLPAHRRRARGRADGQGDEVLQGRRSQLECRLRRRSAGRPLARPDRSGASATRRSCGSAMAFRERRWRKRKRPALGRAFA